MPQVEFRETGGYRCNKWKFETFKKIIIRCLQMTSAKIKADAVMEDTQFKYSPQAARIEATFQWSCPTRPAHKANALGHRRVQGQHLLLLALCRPVQAALHGVEVAGAPGSEWSSRLQVVFPGSEWSPLVWNGHPRLGMVALSSEWSPRLHCRADDGGAGSPLFFNRTPWYKRWVLFSMNLNCFRVFDRFFSLSNFNWNVDICKKHPD